MLTHRNLASNAPALVEAGASRAATCCCTRCRSTTCTACSSRCTARCCRARACCGCRSSTRARSLDALPRATVMMGVPTFYTRLLAEPAFTRERLPQRAPVRLGLGAAAARDVRRVPRAHRADDPRALRHDRDRHDHVEPARRRARRRHGGPAAARRRRCASSTTQGAPCAPGAIGGVEVQGAERLRRLLAHAGEDARGIHRRRLVPHRRRRHVGVDGEGRATCSSSAARRT